MDPPPPSVLNGDARGGGGGLEHVRELCFERPKPYNILRAAVTLVDENSFVLVENEGHKGSLPQIGGGQIYDESRGYSSI